MDARQDAIRRERLADLEAVDPIHLVGSGQIVRLGVPVPGCPCARSPARARAAPHDVAAGPPGRAVARRTLAATRRSMGWEKGRTWQVLRARRAPGTAPAIGGCRTDPDI